MGIRDEMLASCPTGQHTYALSHAACPYCFEAAQRARVLARQAEIAAKMARNAAERRIETMAAVLLAVADDSGNTKWSRDSARAALAAGKETHDG